MQVNIKKKVGNQVFCIGIWILKKWRKSSCLQQLSMTDAKEIEETFLFKLSKAPVQKYIFILAF